MFTERRGLRSLRTSPEQLDKLEFGRLVGLMALRCIYIFLVVCYTVRKG